MAYVLPDFNLVANVWHQPPGGFSSPPLVAPDLVSPACLVARSGYYGAAVFIQGSVILWPLLTDVRDHFQNPGGGGDIVELPAGTGRWYVVVLMDDSGKGHTNEHRWTAVEKPFDWPIPAP